VPITEAGDAAGGAPASDEAARPMARDPLAFLKAMSEEERIALFS
jgi:hypothetical protein